MGPMGPVAPRGPPFKEEESFSRPELTNLSNFTSAIMLKGEEKCALLPTDYVDVAADDFVASNSEGTPKEAVDVDAVVVEADVEKLSDENLRHLVIALTAATVVPPKIRLREMWKNNGLNFLLAGHSLLIANLLLSRK